MELTGGTSRYRNDESSNRRSEPGVAGIIIAVLVVLAFVLSIIAPILAQIIQLAVSRKREFMADASAVEFTRNPQGLIDALQKLSNDPEPLKTANRGRPTCILSIPSNASQASPIPCSPVIHRLKIAFERCRGYSISSFWLMVVGC